MFAILIHRLKL